jgi:hypothetical protein
MQKALKIFRKKSKLYGLIVMEIFVFFKKSDLFFLYYGFIKNLDKRLVYCQRGDNGQEKKVFEVGPGKYFSFLFFMFYSLISSSTKSNKCNTK